MGQARVRRGTIKNKYVGRAQREGGGRVEGRRKGLGGASSDGGQARLKTVYVTAIS